MQLNRICLVLALTLPSAGSAMAGELFELYRQALANDARHAVVKAQQESAQQAVPMAFAGFLPKAALTGGYGRTLLDNQSLGFTGNTLNRDYAFNPENYSAVVVQPIFRKTNFVNYGQAEWEVKQADARYDRSLDDLKARLTGSYLQVLGAAARMDLIEQQKKRYATLRHQAQRAYEAGFGTVTEVAESQSRLDQLYADEATAKAVYDSRLTELRNTIGNPKYIPASFNIPAFKPTLHHGAGLQDWLKLAGENAPALKEQAARVKTAEYEVSKARAGHFPTIDLRMQYGYERDPGYTSIDNTNRSKSVMLSVNVPLYEGGYVVASTRRAAADLYAAREAERGVSDELTVNVETEFGNVIANAVRIDALEKSVATNELLVKATQKSVTAGVRTNVDVLNAENQLFEARLKLTSSRIDYLHSLVKLRAMAGMVQDQELLKIDALMQGAQQ
ncbi:MAG: TolC family outer membrane protein [Chitinivorax sp.]